MEFKAEHIDVITVPAYSDGNYADFDRAYFDLKYKNTPKCLQGRRAPYALILVIAAFIFSFFTQIEAVKIFFRVITVLACLWDFYEQRYVHYYMQAEKYSHLEKYFPRMVKAFEKLLGSKRVYISDMPAAYYILKAKELLYKRDVITAEYLIDQALKDCKNCAEAKYVKALCLLLNDKTAEAKEIFGDVSKMHVSRPVRDAAAALADFH